MIQVTHEVFFYLDLQSSSPTIFTSLLIVYLSSGSNGRLTYVESTSMILIVYYIDIE